MNNVKHSCEMRKPGASPTPIVSLINGQPRTLSTDVAAFFGKQHQHVLRQIRNLANICPDEFGASNFGQSSYLTDQGKAQPAYSMTKDGFTLLAMGFTGPKALKFKLAYIEAFNKMEADRCLSNVRPGCSPMGADEADSPDMARLFPAFDPYLLAKCNSTHPQDRALDYADHKYHDLLTAKIKDEDALATLTGNYSIEPNAPEVIEAYHLLVKFEDMARAFPDALKGMMMMERELAQCRLQLAKVKQAIIDSPQF